MKNLASLTLLSFTLLSFANSIKLDSLLLSEKINLDYQDLSASYSNIQIISDKYAVFKEKVSKNTTQQYNACVQQIKTLKCNNIDQWMSVIAELKLEKDNSEQIEIPFLKEQKLKKLDEYRETLILLQDYDYIQKYNIQGIQQFQKGVENATEQIKIMYKLPEEIPSENEFIQKQQQEQQMQSAKESIKKAKDEYDIADISIQAQTATNVMSSLAGKIPVLEQALTEQYNIQIKLLQEKKQRLKSEILHLRALLQNEYLIQQKNKQKITELNQKISQCKNKPTNIEKDCGPILVLAEKLYTEIDVVNTRTDNLMKELANLLKVNGGRNSGEYQEYLKEREKNEENQREWDFADEQEKELEGQGTGVPAPIEQKPLHQINQKEQIEEQQIKQKIKKQNEEQIDEIEDEEEEQIEEKQEEEQSPIEEEQKLEDKQQNEEQQIEQEQQQQEEEEQQPMEQEQQLEDKQENEEQQIEQEQQQQEEEEQPPIEQQQQQQQQEEEQPPIKQKQESKQDQEITEETQASDAMVFAYKQNPEYQSIADDNNNQNEQQFNIEDQLNDEDENSLDKLLEKEFADEDNSDGNDQIEEEGDIYADKFDYSDE